MTIDSLKWTSSRLFRAVPTGHMIKTQNGRMKAETEGCEYVRIASGETVELTKWYRMMREAVVREGKQVLLEQIKDYCKRLAWLHTDQEIEQYSLECLSHKAYEYWPDFRQDDRLWKCLISAIEAEQEGIDSEHL